MPRAVHTLDAQNKENNPTFRSEMRLKPDYTSSHHSSGAPASTTFSSSGTFTAARTTARFAASQNKIKENLSYRDAMEQKQEKFPTSNFYGPQKNCKTEEKGKNRHKKKEKVEASSSAKKVLIDKINMKSRMNPPGLDGFYDDELNFHTGYTPPRPLIEHSSISSKHIKKIDESKDINLSNSFHSDQHSPGFGFTPSRVAATSGEDTSSSLSNTISSATTSISNGTASQLKSYEIGFKV